jgi:hypothetical protein
MPRFSPPLIAGWALAACLLVATVILLAKASRLRSELARTNVRVANLSLAIESERSWAVALATPGVLTASFTLTPSGDTALRARATVDPATRRALLVFQNFKTPSGHVYELWALRGNTPISLGSIRPDSNGRAVIRVPDMGDTATLTAFAISLEPETAAPSAPAPDKPAPDASAPSTVEPDAADLKEPTGPIVMIGSLGG